MMPREHVAKLWATKGDDHEHVSKHYVKKSLHHSLVAETHRKAAEAADENGDEDSASFHRSMMTAHANEADHYKDEIAHHQDEAKKCAACAKALEGPTGKALSEDDLNKLAPTDVRSIIPTNVPGYGDRLVPRAGQPQPELVNTVDVPESLRKFTEIGDIF